MQRHIDKLNKNQAVLNSAVIINQSKLRYKNISIHADNIMYPTSVPVIVERPLVMWRTFKSPNHCEVCSTEIIDGVKCRIGSCQCTYCSEACENLRYVTYGYAKLVISDDDFNKLDQFTTSTCTGKTILKMQCIILQRYFNMLYRCSTVNQQVTERDLMKHATEPFMLLYESHQTTPWTINQLQQLAETLSSCMKNAESMFKNLHPDVRIENFSNLRFTILTLCSPDFVGFLAKIAHSASLEVQPNIFGLFSTLSFLPHSCIPNCNLDYRDGTLKLMRNNLVADGDELHVNRVGFIGSYNERNYLLLERGIQCECELCIEKK